MTKSAMSNFSSNKPSAPSAQAALEQASSLSYIDALREALETAPPPQKRLRTKARLTLAAATLLAESGYISLRAADVSTRAGVSEGSFYVYFRDKVDVTRSVLTDFMLNFVYPQPSSRAEDRPLGAIVHANRSWLAIARANAGLFRCVLQFADDDAQFGHFAQSANRQWCERVRASVARQRHIDDPDVLLLGIYLLSGMMDDLLRKQVIYPDHELQALLEKLGGGDRTIADAASLLFLRVLYPDRPLPDGIEPQARVLAGLLGPR